MRCSTTKCAVDASLFARRFQEDSELGHQLTTVSPVRAPSLVAAILIDFDEVMLSLVALAEGKVRGRDQEFGFIRVLGWRQKKCAGCSGARSGDNIEVPRLAPGPLTWRIAIYGLWRLLIGICLNAPNDAGRRHYTRPQSELWSTFLHMLLRYQHVQK